MSDDRDAMKMSRAEFERAKRRLPMEAALAEREKEGDRFMENLKQRHENPPQPLKVKPVNTDARTAPVVNGLSTLHTSGR